MIAVSALPFVLWLGSRHAAWIRRRDADLLARSGTRVERAPIRLLDVPISARIASAAVIDGELLMELIAVGDAGGFAGPIDEHPAMQASSWLSARTDAATIEAAELCCAEHQLVRYCDTNSKVVLVEIGYKIVPMQRFAARRELS